PTLNVPPPVPPVCCVVAVVAGTVVDPDDDVLDPHPDAETASAAARTSGISVFNGTSGGFRLWDENCAGFYFGHRGRRRDEGARRSAGDARARGAPAPRRGARVGARAGDRPRGARP